MKDRVLSIDCGTQSLRTIIFTPDGSIVGKEKIEYEPYSSPNPGWAEQDPEIFWTALIEGCRRLAKNCPNEFSLIAGAGVTAQRDTMINLAQDGSTLRPAITWLDTRRAEGSYKPNALMGGIYKLIGMNEALRKTKKDAKCNWIREQQPETWDNTWKYVEVSGFLNFRLCGEPVDSVASMVGHIPFDNKRRGWSGPAGITSKLCPVENSKLYRLVEPGEPAGAVTATASAVTGLPEGLPVIACGSDKACETLGMGCLDRSMASLSFGTTATVEVTTDRYFEPLPFLPAYCAAYPGSWVPEVEIYRGFWMVSWFRDELGHKEQEEARRKGVLPEELFNELLAAEPPGCTGLMM
ncbi:MAG TPA: carbohydrate kinase, partial [Spirochaeta sp.]|nr:carbohydrate kinase [Spirochaeta sp.]